MQLSVVIVNYNVRHFLEQCLYSLRQAVKELDAEIIVVDNNSTDGSLAYLKPFFPEVRFVANRQNEGFGKACNKGWSMAQGRYILFLNPDTIVPEDCLVKCLEFMETKSDAGALGIRMLDGSGRFLKESKRAFPGPATSLYKLFGLYKLFPRSRVFARYHLGHIPENENSKVEVLAGAFMMVKREVLEITGGFDEVFFMYGEDVDLSYRIEKAGYANYYFSGSHILHFKGESTHKGSLNYVRMFYSAMSIFVRKHYGGSKAGIFNMLIHLAIWLRAGLTALGQFIKKMGMPMVDAALIFSSFWLLKIFWTTYIKPETNYDSMMLFTGMTVFTLFYLGVAYWAGLYDRWYKKSRLSSSLLWATLLLLSGYSLLPEQYRFSRGILLFGSLLSFVLIYGFRWILTATGVLVGSRETDQPHFTVVVGSREEYESVLSLLSGTGSTQQVLGRISVFENEPDSVGTVSELANLSQSLPFREIIFCQGQMSFAGIIHALQQVPRGVKSMIHAKDSHSIIGSHFSHTPGNVLSRENGFRLSDPYYRRLKRGSEILFSFLLLVTWPVHALFVKQAGRLLSNCLKVLAGKKTWVGYSATRPDLPRLPRALFSSNGMVMAELNGLPDDSLQKLDQWYAREYRPLDDLRLLFRQYGSLGKAR